MLPLADSGKHLVTNQKETVMGQVNELKDFTRGQLDSVLMKIGHDASMGTAEGIRAYLRGELIVVRHEPKWCEVDGVIYFSVTSDGTTGEAWIGRLEAKSFRLTDYTKQLLRSRCFKPTSGMTTQVAVLKGELFADKDLCTKTIRASATKRKWKKPNAEIACLIREKFSDKDLEEMGLQVIIAMHDPISDSVGDPLLLASHRYYNGRRLGTCFVHLDTRWRRDQGFAFAASKSSLS